MSKEVWVLVTFLVALGWFVSSEIHICQSLSLCFFFSLFPLSFLQSLHFVRFSLLRSVLLFLELLEHVLVMEQGVGEFISETLSVKEMTDPLLDEFVT